MLVAAVVLFAAGLLLGLPLLRALAGFAAGALVVAIVPILGRQRPSIDRVVYPDRVQRGETATAELVVSNTSRVRQPAFVAVDRLGAESREVAVRQLPAGGVARYRYELPTSQRGRVTIGPLTVERSDLLGLASTRSELGQPGELRVYPRRHPVRLSVAGRSRFHHDGDPPPRPGRGSIDLRSLREYVVGDELRHLHWKATARTGQLMVREYVDPAQPWCVVLLDTRATALARAAFEQAVEVAASIVWAACAEDRPVRLCTTEGLRLDVAAGSAAVRDVMDVLCDVVQEPGDESTPDLTRVGGARGDGWFAFAGGSDTAAVRPTAQRFGTSVLFDLSATAVEIAHDGLLALRAPTAEEALRAWNAVVAR